MAKILIVSVGGLDDLQPFLAAGTECAESGHEVTIATSAHLRDWVIFAGLRFVRIAPDFETYGGYHRALECRHDPQVWYRDVIVASLPEMIHDIREELVEADVVITSSDAIGIGQWAEANGKTWISTNQDPAEFQSRFDPVVSLFSNPFLGSSPWVNFVIGGDRGVQQRAAEILAVQVRSTIYSATNTVLPENLLTEDRFSKTLHLCMCSPVIAETRSDWPKNVQFTGYLPFGPTRMAPQLEEWLLSGSKPLVFVSSEPSQDFVMSSASIARRLRRRGLIVAGAFAQECESVGDENIEIVEVTALDTAFARCAGAVIHGGHASFQALGNGVSACISPRTAGEADTARRLELIDLAGTYDGHFGSSGHLDAINEWLEDDEFAYAARNYARTCNPEFGAKLFATSVQNALVNSSASQNGNVVNLFDRQDRRAA